MNRIRSTFRSMFDQTHDLSSSNLLYNYMICGCDNNLVSNSCNLGTKLELKRFDMCRQYSTGKVIKSLKTILLLV